MLECFSRLDTPRWSILVLSVACNRFAAASHSSVVADRPVHLALTLLLTSSLLARAADWYLHPQQLPQSPFRRLLPALDLDGEPRDVFNRWLRGGVFRAASSAADQIRLGFLLLVLVSAVVGRTFAILPIIQYSECSSISLESFIPFIIAALGCLVSVLLYSVSTTSARYSLLGHTSEPRPAQLVQLLTTFTYGLGAYILRISTQGPASTHICPVTTVLPVTIPLLQNALALLDVIILYSIMTIFSHDVLIAKRSDTMHDSLALLRTASNASMSYPCKQQSVDVPQSCVFILLLAGTIRFLAVHEDRYWITHVGFAFLWTASKLNLYFGLGLVSLFSSIIAYGDTAAVMTMSISASAANIPFISPFITLRKPRLAVAGFLAAMFSAWSFFYIGFASTATSESNKPITTRRQRQIFSLVFLVAIVLGSTLLFTQIPRALSSHPIDHLIVNARKEHQSWTSQAKTSTTLPEAVAEYQRRYARNPPPGFDLWYNYATERKSLVIDDFDSLVKDLRPFEQHSPKELRKMTWDVMTDLWTGVASVEIRNGAARVGGNVPDTHRWMVEAAIAIIDKFVEHLPDMDIALNINDEPRIAMSNRDYERNEDHECSQKPVDKPAYHDFTPNDRRASGWKAALRASRGGKRKMPDKSFQNIFKDWGISHCRSAESITSHWDRSQVCSSCVAGHTSQGIFLDDWKAANEICEQPDLSHLHGFYISPAAFKPSHKLYPIFSQSRAAGFADILYPSPWNYNDKAVYAPSDKYPDPPFAQKNATLYWRGGTTEGVSFAASGGWKGMARQRFRHLLGSNSTTADQLVLLPAADQQSAHTAAYLSSLELRTHLPADVRFTDPAIRCGEADCRDQSAEFWPLVRPSDFQLHWRYKYILDLDGAGFSGRFLPFLQSRSLVFKAALFREWYDDRLRAWAHFVPLDLRAQGAWATLVYFAGWKGQGGRDELAERIADDARKWSAAALRKEDMEIYMFRLLLEWGRMTDDRRDALGFSLRA